MGLGILVVTFWVKEIPFLADLTCILMFSEHFLRTNYVHTNMIFNLGIVLG